MDLIWKCRAIGSYSVAWPVQHIHIILCTIYLLYVCTLYVCTCTCNMYAHVHVLHMYANIYYNYSQCSLILNSPIRLQSAWSIFSIYSTDHGVYSWPSAMQVHLSTCNYVQDVQYFYKHLVFIISTVNMKYKIHVFISSTSTYNTRFMFSLSAQGTDFTRSRFTIMHTCTCACA